MMPASAYTIVCIRIYLPIYTNAPANGMVPLAGASSLRIGLVPLIVQNLVHQLLLGMDLAFETGANI